MTNIEIFPKDEDEFKMWAKTATTPEDVKKFCELFDIRRLTRIKDLAIRTSDCIIYEFSRPIKESMICCFGIWIIDFFPTIGQTFSLPLKNKPDEQIFFMILFVSDSKENSVYKTMYAVPVGYKEMAVVDAESPTDNSSMLIDDDMVDIGGMFIPRAEYERMLQENEKDSINSHYGYNEHSAMEQQRLDGFMQPPTGFIWKMDDNDNLTLVEVAPMGYSKNVQPPENKEESQWPTDMPF